MVKQLLVINLKSIYSGMFRRSAKKSSGAKRALVKVGIVALVLYLIVIFASLVVGLAVQMRDPFAQLGIGWLYFTINALIVLMLCIVTCIFTAMSQIFNAKDNELLLSMPIKPSHILISRILTMLVVEYIYEAVISIPMYIVWVAGGYFNFIGLVSFIVEFLLLPLFGLAVACLLAWIISLITSRMRRKNAITLIISLVFFAAYIWLFSNLQGYIQTMVLNGSAIADAFRNGFPPLYYIGSAVSSGNILHLLIFIAFAVIPFVIVVALLSRSFVRVATTNRGMKKVQYKAKTLKSSGHIMAINKLELRRYSSNAGIVLNTSLGGIFAIIIGAYLLFARSSAMELVDQIGGLFSVTNFIPIALAVIFAMTNAMNTLSAGIISLEGKTLWVVRSMPISSRSVLLGKLLTHLEISIIPLLIGCVMSIIALLSGDILGMALVILLPIIFAVFIGSFGLILNLLMPKFEWTHETQPVKQGVPILVVMFGTIAFIIGIIMLYAFVLSRVMDVLAFAWLATLIIAILDVIMLRWIATSGAKRFDALEA